MQQVDPEPIHKSRKSHGVEARCLPNFGTRSVRVDFEIQPCPTRQAHLASEPELTRRIERLKAKAIYRLAHFQPLSVESVATYTGAADQQVEDAAELPQQAKRSRESAARAHWLLR